MRGLKTSPSSTIEGVLARLAILGIVGSGQVKSWSSSGQKGRIFSKRYHCRSDDKPFGTTLDGRVRGFGVQVLFSSSFLLSVVSH